MPSQALKARDEKNSTALARCQLFAPKYRLDFTKLDALKHEGSVRNYLDRRRDLYRVEWLGSLPQVKNEKS